MSDILKAAANAAGLNPAQKQVVDALSKALAVHQELSNLPANVAQQKYQTYTPAQQQTLTKMFGEDQTPEGKRSILGNVAHYAGAAVSNTVGKVFGAMQYASDLMTRAYRTGAVMQDFNVDIVKAWDIAGRSGEKLFAPDRIANANLKYGADRMAVAQRVASGESLSAIQASAANQAQADIAAMAAQKQDNLFQDALDAAHAAQYSPGRMIANLILPEALEGSGVLYKLISGLTDAAYRTVTDPTLWAGKAYKGYQIAKWSLDAMVVDKAVTGGQKIEQVFSNAGTIKLWDQAGVQMKALRQAKEVLKKTPKSIEAYQQAAVARQSLKQLIPELNPQVWDTLSKAEYGIEDAVTMKNFLLNSDDGIKLLSGQAVRMTPIMPRMTPARQARISVLTTGNKIREWSKIDNQVLDALYGIGDDVESVQAGLVNAIGSSTKKALASDRFSTNRVKYNVDRFIARFQQMPLFADNEFDVMGPNAVRDIYKFARLQLPHHQSAWIAEYFDNASEGVRKEIFDGLWNSMANVKQISKTPTGQFVLTSTARAKKFRSFAVTGDVVDDAGNALKSNHNPALFPDGQQHALLVSDTSTKTMAPDLKALTELAARDGLMGRIAGISNHDAFRSLVNYWNFLTLAGPRFAVRNAIEDYMVHLAVGKNAWGLPQARILSTQLRLARNGVDLGWVNRIALKAKRDTYAVKYTEIMGNKALTAEQKFDETRKLMGTAMAETKLGMLGKKVSPEKWDLFHEQVVNGNIDNMLGTVGEGASNTYAGMDKYARATRLQDMLDGMGISELVVDGQKYRRVMGKGYQAIALSEATPENKIAYMNNIHRYASDDLGKRAIAYLDDRQAGIAELTDYLRSNPQIRERFRLAGYEKFDEADHAERLFDATHMLFSRSDGTLNRELLNRIRPVKGSTEFKIADFGVDDLPTLAADMPRAISGAAYVAIGDGAEGGWLRNFVDRRWWHMGQANARFSREPIAVDATHQLREQWRNNGYEDTIYQQLTGKTREAAWADPELAGAVKAAKKHLADLAEERATSYTLAYVDNPLVQSQLAFVGKNMARYYRATEDFYRRMGRALRYNPDALAKANLVYEGITHSGFVETDDQGQKYFVFPGTAIVYKAVQGVMQLFGVDQDFKMPMPLDFKARLTMITPSMNPDSLMPTFAGPVAAVPMKALTSIIGNFSPDLADDITKLTMGQYAVDQPLVNAILPAHINRLYAALNRDDQDSQYASASRKALTYLAAAGLVPQPTVDPATGMEMAPSAGEVKEFKEKLRNATLAILGTRAILGFVAPASPQVDLKSDMAKWVKDNGQQSFKTVFNDLINQTGDYNKAMEIWIAKYPNQMPFTVSESQSQVRGLIRSIEPVGKWLDKYGDVAKQYPEAAAFLMPQTGAMSFDVYRTLSNEGFIKRKDLESFYNDITTAADLKVYYANRDNYQTQLANTFDDYTKQQLKAGWESWKTPWLSARPEVQAELAQGGERQVARQKALADIRRMLLDKSVKASPKARLAISQMVELYDQYKAQQASSNAFPGYAMFSDTAKTGVKQQMEAIAAANPNASAVYDRVFRPLIGD